MRLSTRICRDVDTSAPPASATVRAVRFCEGIARGLTFSRGLLPSPEAVRRYDSRLSGSLPTERGDIRGDRERGSTPSRPGRRPSHQAAVHIVVARHGRGVVPAAGRSPRVGVTAPGGLRAGGPAAASRVRRHRQSRQRHAQDVCGDGPDVGRAFCDVDLDGAHTEESRELFPRRRASATSAPMFDKAGGGDRRRGHLDAGPLALSRWRCTPWPPASTSTSRSRWRTRSARSIC